MNEKLIEGYKRLLENAKADKEYLLSHKDKLNSDIYKNTLENAEADIALAQRKISGLSMPALPVSAATETAKREPEKPGDSGLIDAAFWLAYFAGGYLLTNWARKDPANRMEIVNAYFGTTQPKLQAPVQPPIQR